MGLFKISGIHGGDYEDCRLLGCFAVFLRNVGSYKSHTASYAKRQLNLVSLRVLLMASAIFSHKAPPCSVEIEGQ
jgi:hypothetical protein